MCRHEPRDSVAVLRDLDLFAGGDLVEKGEQPGLCFGGGQLADHMVTITVSGTHGRVGRPAAVVHFE